MAKGQVVKRIVNALATQDRIMYHAACGHVVSVTTREITAAGRKPEEYLENVAMIECPFCPDPPPPTPEDERRAKTANQLWKEAGQP